MDVHVRRSVTAALRSRGFDVLTAQDDGSDLLDDAALLDRAGELERVLFSQDKDLLRVAAARQRRGEGFRGLIFAHQQSSAVGQCIRDLALICDAYDIEDIRDRVEFIPL